MIDPLIFIFTALLIIFTIFDMKARAVPSVLLTITIIFLTFVKFENFQWAVVFGLIGFLLWEFSEANNVAFGVADIKVMIMMGFFVSDVYIMMMLLIIFAVGQLIYFTLLVKYGKFKEIPFIPLFLGIWLGGVISGVFV